VRITTWDDSHGEPGQPINILEACGQQYKETAGLGLRKVFSLRMYYRGLLLRFPIALFCSSKCVPMGQGAGCEGWGYSDVVHVFELKHICQLLDRVILRIDTIKLDVSRSLERYRNA
jgi:hypothetical protein